MVVKGVLQKFRWTKRIWCYKNSGQQTRYLNKSNNEVTVSVRQVFESLFCHKQCNRHPLHVIYIILLFLFSFYNRGSWGSDRFFFFFYLLAIWCQNSGLCHQIFWQIPALPIANRPHCCLWLFSNQIWFTVSIFRLDIPHKQCLLLFISMFKWFC